MHYWITTHWPLCVDEPGEVAAGVWLPHDRPEVGAALRPGDLVLIYQAQGGRTIVRTSIDGARVDVPRKIGKGGIVAIGRVRDVLHRLADSQPEEYTNGTSVHWAWFAPLDLVSTSGFVSRAALNGILGYAENYVLRGFGDRKSGLKKIDRPTYERIAAAFTAERPATVPRFRIEPPPGGPPDGEGEPHRLLKEYVAGAPPAALGEAGLVLKKMEHVFPSADRADVVLVDAFGRIVGVEVEVHVGEQDVVGVLQALKYRAMLEPLYDRNPGDSRAVLVAYSISPAMRTLCTRYGVEWLEVPDAVVREWHEQHAAPAG
jgi:hypothetical protein